MEEVRNEANPNLASFRDFLGSGCGRDSERPGHRNPILNPVRNGYGVTTPCGGNLVEKVERGRIACSNLSPVPVHFPEKFLAFGVTAGDFRDINRQSAVGGIRKGRAPCG